MRKHRQICSKDVVFFQIGLVCRHGTHWLTLQSWNLCIQRIVISDSFWECVMPLLRDAQDSCWYWIAEVSQITSGSLVALRAETEISRKEPYHMVYLRPQTWGSSKVSTQTLRRISQTTGKIPRLWGSHGQCSPSLDSLSCDLISAMLQRKQD